MAAQRHMLNEKQKEMLKTKNGEVLSFNTIEGQTSLNIGDDIREKLGLIEVLTKDFKIIKIKNKALVSSQPKILNRIKS